MSESWGPWDVEASRLRLRGKASNACCFSPDGIDAVQDGEHVELPWVEVVSVEVEVPAQPLWLWWLLAPLFLLVPSAIQESHEVYVRVVTRHGVQHLNLGRPDGAPFSRRCRSGTVNLFAHRDPGVLRDELAAGRARELLASAQSGR